MARLHAGRRRGGVTEGAAASRLHGGIRDIITYIGFVLDRRALAPQQT
jgi:hypothetical protein